MNSKPKSREASRLGESIVLIVSSSIIIGLFLSCNIFTIVCSSGSSWLTSTEKAFSFFNTPKLEEYQVEHTLDALHGIKKEEPVQENLEAEKTLIEAKSKLRERRKAPKKIKTPKDVE